VRPAGLTEREVDVLGLLAIEATTTSPGAWWSVRAPHVRSVFAKLGVSTRAAAAHEASLLNLL
jgi:ATP/maltotriose-dependent transcriptional regulator MalT